jgi:hypothetical protein
MKVKEVCRTVEIDGQQIQVLLGDDIWWFAQNQTKTPPAPAKLMEFQSVDMVKLAYLSATGKWTVTDGVCLLTDPNLSNHNYSKRGSWCPRGSWKALEIEA